MKKILLLALVFGFLKSFGQYPVKQHIGGDSTEIWGTTFWGKKGLINGIYADTATANTTRIKEYPYAQIATDSTLWLRNSSATAWIRIASGNSGGPTIIYVKDDLTVDTITNPGFQTLGRLHSDGLVSGGILTSDSCMSVQLTSASYYLNGIHYISPQTTLVVAAADPTNGRIDKVVADTFGVVSIITGTPSATPSAPSHNPASQLVLNLITVPAGATCLSINSIVIYDETGGTEYTPSDAGTITADPNNTDNPEHLIKDYFISSYADGAQIIFTKPSGQDTVFNNSVFRWGQYNNGRFNNQLQMQLFLGAVPVSNNISVNPYFNILDSNAYQTVAVPSYAFTLSGGGIFDKIVYTLAGNDLSGALGFYMDWLQLQTGFNNTNPGNFVDSVTRIGDSLYYFKNGLQTFITSIGVDSSNISPITTFRWSVLDSLNTPVVSPAQGNPYLVGTVPTGVFVGHANQIAIYDTTAGYAFNTATVGDLLFNATTQEVSEWTGTDWVRVTVNNYVHITGVETILGKKSFADTLILLAKPIEIITNGNIPVSLLTTRASGVSFPWLLINGDANGSKIIMGANNPASLDDQLRIVADYTDSIWTGTYRPLVVDVYEYLKFNVNRAGTNDTVVSFTTFGNRYLGLFNNSGQLTLSQYADSAFSGTPIACAAFDAAGKLIKVACGGGGTGTVTNIATGYGLSGGPITTTGTVIVDSAALSTKYLRIVDTANIRFRPVAGSNITLTGTYPNITIEATAGGSGTVTTVTGTSPIIITSTPTTTPNVTLGTVPIANGGTNNASLSVTAGTLYYGDGTKLIGLAPGTSSQILHSGTTPSWQDTTAISAASGWGILGNSGLSAATNFMGTTDNIPVRFRQNNIFKMQVDTGNRSDLFIGNRPGMVYEGKANLLIWDTVRSITSTPGGSAGNPFYFGIGVVRQVYKLTGDTTVGTVTGAFFEPRIGPTNTANWTGTSYGLVGVRASNNTQSGATGTLARASSVDVVADYAGMTITNRYGIFIANPTISGTAVLSKNYGIWIQNQTASTLPSENYGIYSNAYNNTFIPAAQLSSGGTSSTYVLQAVATQAATPPGTQNAVEFTITGAGSSGTANNALMSNYLAGYTGAGSNNAIRAANANAGTGTNIVASLHNSGIFASDGGTTTGTNQGVTGWASNGNISIGVLGEAIVLKNSGKNIGVMGFGLNTGTTPFEIGGAFYLRSTDPTIDISSALLADNSAEAVNILTLRDNATNVFEVQDGGKIVLAATNTTVGTTGNQTINKASGTVNIAAAGTTVTVTNSLVTASSIVLAIIRTNDATARISNVVPAAGSFVINIVACTAEVSIGFLVIN